MEKIASLKIIFDEKTQKKLEVLMSLKEFNALIEKLEDLYDLNIAYERSLKKDKILSYEEVMKDILPHGKRK